MKTKTQTQRNLIFNALTLSANIVVGLFYTPYLVKSLGIMAYGVVPLSLVINHYISVITTSLTGTLTRFYSISLGKKELENASKYLSSSFMALTGLIVLLSPFFVYLIANLDHVFNIPEEIVPSAKALFTFTILSFLLSLFSSLLNVTLYARNRLDLMNFIKCIRLFSRVSITVYLFESIKQDVAYIGYANFATEAIVILFSIFLYKRTSEKEVTISVRYIRKAVLISVFTMTFWVVVHQLGDTGLYKIDNILVNRFWSTRESGILGAFSEFGTYVTSVVAVIGTLFGPLILNAYSIGDHKKVKDLALNNSLLVGAISALMIGVIIGFSEPIIGLWLGKEYAKNNDWFILKMITLPFYAASGVFAFVYRAWNKLVLPAVITLIIGIVNFAVSFVIVKNSGGNKEFILYMLAASALFVLLQSYFLNAYSFWRVYPEIRVRALAGNFLKILTILVVTILFSELYTQFIIVDNLIMLGLGLAVISSICALLGFFFISTSVQKDAIMSFFKNRKLVSK